MPISDPWFYVAAVPALLLVGVSKGGFGGGLGLVAVPLLSLTVPPAQAAAIMLPILCLMDAFGVGAYRQHWDGRILAVLLPAAAVGILAGTLAFGLLSADVVRLLLGSIALWFGMGAFLPARRRAPPAAPSRWRGGFWAAVSGFTSTIAHAGGPPINIYLLPLRLDKTVFVGTVVVYFTAVNLLKIPPYAAIGQFSTTNLMTALVLAPLAPLGMLLGIRLHSRVSPVLFYRLCYGFVLLAGGKLIWDALA